MHTKLLMNRVTLHNRALVAARNVFIRQSLSRETRNTSREWPTNYPKVRRISSRLCQSDTRNIPNS